MKFMKIGTLCITVITVICTVWSLKVTGMDGIAFIATL